MDNTWYVFVSLSVKRALKAWKPFNIFLSNIRRDFQKSQAHGGLSPISSKLIGSLVQCDPCDAIRMVLADFDQSV